MMYQVYYTFTGNISDCTSEEFAQLKKFYKLYKLSNGEYTNKRMDIFVWRKEKKNEK